MEKTGDVGEVGVVASWLRLAEAEIDERFGEGFAMDNPVLLGAFVQACAIASVRTALTDELINGLDDVRKALFR